MKAANTAEGVPVAAETIINIVLMVTMAVMGHMDMGLGEDGVVIVDHRRHRLLVCLHS